MMESVLRLRFKDPETLSELELMRASRNVFDDRQKLGPDRMSLLLRVAKDRLGMDWKELSAFTGYPMPTLFSLTR